MKKLMIFLSAFALVFATVPAFAAEETGSINVTLKTDNEAVDVSDGTFELYKVADIVKTDTNDYEYEYTAQFADCGYALDIDDAALAEDLLAWADETGAAAAEERTPDHGLLIFSDVPLGLYLVAQGTACDGYYAALPFLVSVPLYEDGAWTYAVDASPKMEPLVVKETTTQPKTKTSEPKTTTSEPKTTTSEPKTTTVAQTPTSTSSDNNGTKTSTPTSTGNKTSSTSNAKTGDAAPIVGAALIAAAAALAVVMVVRRRRVMR